jgi:hypothetical protein
MNGSGQSRYLTVILIVVFALDGAASPYTAPRIAGDVISLGGPGAGASLDNRYASR